jgi:phosphodiesterase/alkaline phosphatase D-like protein
VLRLLLLLLLPCLPGCNAADTVADALGDGDNDAPFPFGVASGDVTASRAVLWTRTRQAAPLTLEVSTSAHFTSQPALMQTVKEA